MTSLNPVLARRRAARGRRSALHTRLAGSAISRPRFLDLLKRVGIPATAERGAPQFSRMNIPAGMRQAAPDDRDGRCQQSRAADRPDEPTTGRSNVTIQDQIITLIARAQSLIRYRDPADHPQCRAGSRACVRAWLVMYAGRIVEEGPTEAIFRAPQHPYTWSLLRSVPRVDTADKEAAFWRSAANRRIRATLPDRMQIPIRRCPFAIARLR